MAALRRLVTDCPFGKDSPEFRSVLGLNGDNYSLPLL